MKDADRAFKLRNELDQMLSFQLFDNGDKHLATLEYVGDGLISLNGDLVDVDDLVDLGEWAKSLQAEKQDLSQVS